MRAGPILVAALVLAGCGSDPAVPPVATGASTTATTATTAVPEPVEGLVATVEVARLFIQIRSFGLGLQNVGDVPVEVASVQLETPLYETIAAAEQPVVLTPGRLPTVVPVPYGDPICDGDPATDDFTANITLVDGTELTLVAPEHYAGGIGRTHARECRARAVLAQVDVRFGDDWAPGEGHSVRGELLFEQRQPGPPVELQSVAGTVIFGFDAGDGEPIARITDDDPSVAVPVVISAERCDPHGLTEAKRAYIFALWAALGDDPPASIEVEPEGAARVAIDAMLAGCQESFLG